jgi:hypothetical protein
LNDLQQVFVSKLLRQALLNFGFEVLFRRKMGQGRTYDLIKVPVKNVNQFIGVYQSAKHVSELVSKMRISIMRPSICFNRNGVLNEVNFRCLSLSDAREKVSMYNKYILNM